MRLYAFLLVAGAALCARAASIPVAETEKKYIDIVPDNLEKLPENTSSEQELIDQANTINDVDNKLRAKPENIPVEVVVEKAQPPLDAIEEQDEEINRPVPDLRNPGPPQRQEHETQNPEFYANEQQTVTLFKQSINDAQNILSQGFKGITDGIEHIVATNEPIQSIQLRIQALRDSFSAQIVKVNGTIQSYLNTESASNDKPAVEQTKAGFHQIEQGLFKLRSEFNRGVSSLASGVDVVAALKADSEAVSESSGSNPSSTSAAPPAQVYPIIQAVQGVQHQVQEYFNNFQDMINRVTQSWSSPVPTTGAVVPEGVQSDAQVTPAPTAAPPSVFQNIQNFQNQIGNFFTQGLNPGQTQNQNQPGTPGPVQQAFNNFINLFNSNNNKPATPASSAQPVQTPSTPDSQAEPAKPSETPTQTGTGTPAATPTGPVRQILQNNPITKGIAGAVQRLQNINNPEKPRDEQAAEHVKNVVDQADIESKKGGGPNTGDNNDNSDRVEQPEEVKEEIEKVSEVQKVPEIQKVSEDEIKEHKTEEVVDKTE